MKNCHFKTRNVGMTANGRKIMSNRKSKLNASKKCGSEDRGYLY